MVFETLPVHDCGGHCPPTTNMKIKLKQFFSLTALILLQTGGVNLPQAVLASPITEITISWQNAQTIRTLTGHSQSVGALAISPDGKTLVSGSDDTTIKVWNLETGNLLLTLTGHTDIILSLAISPNGQTIASSSLDGTVKLWNLQTGELIRTIKRDWLVKSIAYSPDGQKIAIGSWNKTRRKAEIEVWNSSTGEVIQSFSLSRESNLFVAFSPDGKTLGSANEDGTIKLWNMDTGESLPTLKQDNAVKAIAFSPDGKTLLSVSYTQTVKVWDLQTGTNLTPLKTLGVFLVNAVAFTPNNQMFASAIVDDDNTLGLWDLQTGKLLQIFTGYSNWVSSLAFTPNGQTLVSGSWDGTITIWQGK